MNQLFLIQQSITSLLPLFQSSQIVIIHVDLFRHSSLSLSSPICFNTNYYVLCSPSFSLLPYISPPLPPSYLTLLYLTSFTFTFFFTVGVLGRKEKRTLSAGYLKVLGKLAWLQPTWKNSIRCINILYSLFIYDNLLFGKSHVLLCTISFQFCFSLFISFHIIYITIFLLPT